MKQLRVQLYNVTRAVRNCSVGVYLLRIGVWHVTTREDTPLSWVLIAATISVNGVASWDLIKSSHAVVAYEAIMI